MLAPLPSFVTLSVSHTGLPVLASRHTSSPEDLAEKTWPPRIKPVEVTLRTLRDAAFESGHSTEAAGFSGSSFSIRPLMSSRFLWKAGVVTALAADVLIFSRQYVLPVAGSSAYTPSCAQTINWRLAPASMTTGELFVSPPVGTFQTSL